MRGLEFSLWRIRDLLSTRAYLTITEALAAILLIAPELTGGDGFCGSLCKFAWVTCDRWLRWEILAIQTIKIRSEIRVREREGGEGEGETTDCEAGTYFTHSVVICQALAPNYSDYSDVLSISGDAGWCWYKPWLWLTSVTAHQRPGRAGRAGVRSPGFSTNELFSQGYLGSSALQTPETFVTCHTMSRRRHRGCWQETRTLISWWRNSDNVWR